MECIYVLCLHVCVREKIEVVEKNKKPSTLTPTINVTSFLRFHIISYHLSTNACAQNICFSENHLSNEGLHMNIRIILFPPEICQYSTEQVYWGNLTIPSLQSH